MNKLMTEVQSIRHIATCFISSELKVSLPKTLHDALNNIFTKGKGDQLKYREQVVIEETTGSRNVSHHVLKGKRNAIYNALCLYAILGTSETKKLFQHYYSTKQFIVKRDFSILNSQQSQRYLEFSCFGISYENIKLIEEYLHKADFDLFSDKLPSPYSTLTEQLYDLTPMIEIYGKGIPWDKYMAIYQKAERSYELKEYNNANKLLEELNQESALHLPIVQSLQRKISMELNEANEALEYLQKILN